MDNGQLTIDSEKSTIRLIFSACSFHSGMTGQQGEETSMFSHLSGKPSLIPTLFLREMKSLF
jgi:hypothetical protein